MSGLLEDKDNDLRKRDVNATIRRVMFEVETAAQAEPEEACHPYAAETRRKVVVRAIWDLYRRFVKDEL